MTKNTTYTERFTIDFISKKIIGTQASFNKASKGTGEIYEELASKIARHLVWHFFRETCDEMWRVAREKRWKTAPYRGSHRTRSGLPVGETMKWPVTKPATARPSRAC